LKNWDLEVGIYPSPLCFAGQVFEIWILGLGF